MDTPGRFCFFLQDSDHHVADGELCYAIFQVRSDRWQRQAATALLRIYVICGFAGRWQHLMKLRKMCSKDDHLVKLQSKALFRTLATTAKTGKARKKKKNRETKRGSSSVYGNEQRPRYIFKPQISGPDPDPLISKPDCPLSIDSNPVLPKLSSLSLPACIPRPTPALECFFVRKYGFGIRPVGWPGSG